jgi:hypothetical protein
MFVGLACLLPLLQIMHIFINVFATKICVCMITWQPLRVCQGQLCGLYNDPNTNYISMCRTHILCYLSRSYHWKTWARHSKYLQQHNGGGETTMCMHVLFKNNHSKVFLKIVVLNCFANVTNFLTKKLTDQFPMNNLMDALGVC